MGVMDKMSDTNDEIQIDIPDLLRSVWELRLLVLVLMILGGLTGAVLPWSDEPSYETRASMIVNAKNTEAAYQNGTANPRGEDIALAQNLSKTVQLLATSDRVLKKVLEEGTKDSASTERLRQAITVTGEEGTAFIWLTLNWEDPQQAAGLLNRLMEVLPDVMLEVMDIGSVKVIDTAGPVTAVSSASAKKIILGILVGLFAGCGIGAAWYLFVPKIRGNSALENLGVDVIGEIPGFRHTREKGRDIWMKKDCCRNTGWPTAALPPCSVT